MTIKVNDLQKSYRRSEGKLREVIPVLQGIDLEVEAGKSLAIVGASGIGKSTLLHCLGLLDPVDSGSIEYDGVSVSSDSREDRALARRKYVGFVFQFHYLMAELSALENVAIPLLLYGASKGEAWKRAENFLIRVGLEHRLSHRPSELSGGEQQRVAIARALVHKPRIILADEPTGNLDPETARKVFDVLTEECKALNSILIMATHNLDLAKNLERVATLNKGKLVQ